MAEEKRLLDGNNESNERAKLRPGQTSSAHRLGYGTASSTHSPTFMPPPNPQPANSPSSKQPSGESTNILEDAWNAISSVFSSSGYTPINNNKK